MLSHLSSATLVIHVPAPQSSIHDSELDKTIKYRWNKAVEVGLFRYRLDHLQNRVLPGKYGFVVQVNFELSVYKSLIIKNQYFFAELV